MAQSNVASPYASNPSADRIMSVGPGAPVVWLTAGWRDFVASPGPSLAYGFIFVLAGVVLAAALSVANMIYLFVPLTTGFLLIGPAATLGFYAIGRDLEAGRPPSFKRALNAFQANPGPMLYVGFALLAMFLVWIRLAQLIYAVSLPYVVGLDAQSLMHSVLFTPNGQVFLALTCAAGAVMAALVFAGSAFALPMLLDRPVGMGEAVATSWLAVTMNLPAMAVWAVLLVVLTAIGFAMAFIGLAITLPLAGLATWHAYRAVIRRGTPAN